MSECTPLRQPAPQGAEVLFFCQSGVCNAEFKGGWPKDVPVKRVQT